MALEELFEKAPVILSGIAKFDETFVLDCYKGAPVPKEAGRKARKHGAKAAKPGISREYVAICTGIQRDSGTIAETLSVSGRCRYKKSVPYIGNNPPNDR